MAFRWLAGAPQPHRCPSCLGTLGIIYSGAKPAYGHVTPSGRITLAGCPS